MLETRYNLSLRTAIFQFWKSPFQVFEYTKEGNKMRPYFVLGGAQGYLSDAAIRILFNSDLDKKEKVNRLRYMQVYNEKNDTWVHYVYAAPYYSVQQENKYGLCNRNGKIVIPIECQDIFVSPQYIKLKKHGTYQILDAKTLRIIVPYGVYQYIDYFYRNLARARSVEGGWGIIDTHGHIIVPFEYNEVYQFVNRSDLKRTKLIKNHQTFYVSFDEMHRVSEAGGWDKTTCSILPERKTYHRNDEDDSWRDDAELDTWYALTDGEYGDMPEAFDGDYSFMGL